MEKKTIMAAAWILMLMMIVEASAAAASVTAVSDEVGSPGRLLKAAIPPSAPSHGHNDCCPTTSSQSKLPDGMNGRKEK